MSHRLSEVSAALTAFLGAAVLLAFWTAHYGATWPFRDSYGYFHYLSLARSRALGLTDLISVRWIEHPVAFHFAFALAILQLFDVNTKVIVFANATLLFAAALITYRAVRDSASTRSGCLALPVLIVVSFINPSQTSYLLWEFQIWFYIDLALLAANTLFIERFGYRAYPSSRLVLPAGHRKRGAGIVSLACGRNPVFSHRPECQKPRQRETGLAHSCDTPLRISRNGVAFVAQQTPPAAASGACRTAW
jgi:hypothetical protein